MRIGIDATPMFRERGGVGWYAYHLTTSLARIDDENTYVLYRDSSSKFPIGPCINQHNFSSVDVPKWRMRHQVRRDAIEIFHGLNYRLPAYGRYGSVITVHDLALDRFPHHSRKFFGQRWASLRARSSFSRADRLIAVSQHTAHDLCRYYQVSSGRIDVVYHGGGLARSTEHTNVALDFLNRHYGFRDGEYILHVGGGEPRKNILGLLKAYSMLGDLRQRYQLILVGGMGRWMNQIVREIRHLGLVNDVLITGYVAQEHLSAFYKHASLFVYPSLYEGFGIPPLEAMATGIPVIAANTSSLPEVLGEAAIMVDPLQPAALAQSIRTVLSDPILREKLREKGLSQVKNFSWEQAARNTLAVYTSVFLKSYDRRLDN